ncbi:MAG: DUF421 domain-containing protein [Oscillospiraceae bacterium]
MTIIFLRAIILYVLIIFSIRLMGKRQIGELQPSELVITILVSNIATLPLEDNSLPMIMGIIPILVLVCLDVLMSTLTLKFRKLRKVVSGSPRIIIRDGVVDQVGLKLLRFSLDDLMESLHSYNIFDISEVQFAVIETTGKISVYQKFPDRTATAKDLKLVGKSENPPYIIIDDGILIKDALNSAKVGEGWVGEILKEKKLAIKNVFLMSVSADKKYNIIEKNSNQRKEQK